MEYRLSARKIRRFQPVIPFSAPGERRKLLCLSTTREKPSSRLQAQARAASTMEGFCTTTREGRSEISNARVRKADQG